MSAVHRDLKPANVVYRLLVALVDRLAYPPAQRDLHQVERARVVCFGAPS